MITAQQVTDLAGFEFTLSYDPALLKAQSASIGSFLTNTGRTTSLLGPNIDNTAGTIHFGAFSFGTQPGASGSGPIALIRFQPLAVGTSALHWQAATLVNTAGANLPAAPVDGKIILIP
ncbi:MAG: hypothetical protein D6775_09255 [Caldilineae bacterium]|nr:MAG: hypothetical protein D6775_09255 [Caldilineae bacterium]